jgi:hypothetical protein
MKKFYQYQNGLDVRYYKNLSRLCENENLTYSNVYHSIVRLKKGVWSDNEIQVQVLFFSGT